MSKPNFYFQLLTMAVFLLPDSLAYSQNNAPVSPTTTTTDPNDPAATTTNTQAARTLDGFDGTAWGSLYKDVKEKMRTLSSTSNPDDQVEIISDNPDREILINRKDIWYRYVFYKRPDNLPARKDANGQEIKKEAAFFYAESLFPPVATEDLYKRLAEKYGQRTNSTLNKKNSGAYIWDLEGGYLVQWIQPYKNKPYTRNLVYVSKKFKDEIIADMQDFQYEKEVKAVQNLLR